mmetsp:Transcript_88515/g.166926  ORF Transcript_88515/g.166926 Transcript_88515/m.166926 type:complete len:222 (-) Transcript_88515:176-841(-)
MYQSLKELLLAAFESFLSAESRQLSSLASYQALRLFLLSALEPEWLPPGTAPRSGDAMSASGCCCTGQLSSSGTCTLALDSKSLVTSVLDSKSVFRESTKVTLVCVRFLGKASPGSSTVAACETAGTSAGEGGRGCATVAGRCSTVNDEAVLAADGLVSRTDPLVRRICVFASSVEFCAYSRLSRSFSHTIPTTDSMPTTIKRARPTQEEPPAWLASSLGW